jgi:CspA family cold shock protein
MMAARTCLSIATALERAGIRGLVEGQKVSFDTQEDRRTGKIAVGNIQAA